MKSGNHSGAYASAIWFCTRASFSSQRLTAQAAGNDMGFTGTVSEPASLTVGGNAATVDSAGNWTAHAAVSTGANSIAVAATDVNSNTTNKTISVTVSGGSSRTLSYDANGNMTNDGGGKTYEWDVADRLIKITQSGDVTEFAYNGLGQRVKEKLNGTVIKQWVWGDGAQPWEERDASNAVTKRFFGRGQQVAGTAYFYAVDHLGSIREMTDGTGAIRARYDYDPYGRITKVSGDLESDFGFTSFYRHQASGLSLTYFRAYDPELGRWLSRDPLGDRGGVNLYGYVGNNPVNAIDPFGLVERIDPEVVKMLRLFFKDWNPKHIQNAPTGELEKAVKNARDAQKKFDDETKGGDGDGGGGCPPDKNYDPAKHRDLQKQRADQLEDIIKVRNSNYAIFGEDGAPLNELASKSLRFRQGAAGGSIMPGLVNPGLPGVPALAPVPVFVPAPVLP